MIEDAYTSYYISSGGRIIYKNKTWKLKYNNNNNIHKYI
jgi:hypothetical protein